MEIKDISRDRLEQIAKTLFNRVEMFERDSNFFANALGYDCIKLEEAEAFGFSFDDEDVITHKICWAFNNCGTYRFYFKNDDVIDSDDSTEFFVNNEDEAMDLWYDFCDENGLDIICLTDIEFVCQEAI